MPIHYRVVDHNEDENYTTDEVSATGRQAGIMWRCEHGRRQIGEKAAQARTYIICLPSGEFSIVPSLPIVSLIISPAEPICPSMPSSSRFWSWTSSLMSMASCEWGGRGREEREGRAKERECAASIKNCVLGRRRSWSHGGVLRQQYAPP
jgi:hypothetical protein